MKKIILSFVLLLFAFTLACKPVYAQGDSGETTRLGILEVDLRPEFDRTEMLVIYHIVLTSDTQLPATVTIPIPKEAVKPSALAWVDPVDGSMYSLEYQVEERSGMVYVTFTTTAREIALEYYDPGLAISGVTRDYTFRWPGGFTVDALNFYFLQPKGAENVVIKPDMGSARNDANGTLAYYKELGSFQPGNSFEINIRYDKATDELTAVDTGLQPAEPITDSTRGRTSLGEVIPWIAGSLLFLFVVFITWWVWLSRKTRFGVDKSGKRHNVSRKAYALDEDVIHCHECGQRAVKGDVFCRVCGAKLRIE